jgi:adenylate kinase
MTARRPVRLALLGKPGSGKGTQGAALARILQVPLVSLGDILRRRAAEPGEASHELAEMLDRGELLPDDLVVSVVRDAVRASDDRGYILDGFPRTVGQAQSDAVPIDAVVNLDLPDEDARARLAHRAEGRTDDADRDAIGRRLRQFRTETAPLIDLYRRRGMLTTVDATKPPTAVSATILDALGATGQDTESPRSGDA